jgi:maltooligosyltrehalose trehalohydrolase
MLPIEAETAPSAHASQRRASCWTPRVGAWPSPEGWQTRLWAPGASRVELIVEGHAPRDLARLADGHFGGAWGDLRDGDRYRYRIDGRGPFPDPASRSQPDGVHAPSQLVDPRAFVWTDASWRGVALEDLVLYELHVGTFSPEGTFAGVVAKLPILADLGVTAIELLPVASFAGSRNWGYDGTALFAPAAVYGGPDGLRALVDAAHRLGIGVVLDVVYNHFGPAGAYHTSIDPAYGAAADGPWGLVPNLRAPGHQGVRDFFIDNALHWLHEYHLDGLRFDATHAFVDEGAPPFLDELVAAVRAATPRPVLLMAEDDRNDRRLIEPPSAGGAGLDAVWADDIHHQIRVGVAGDRDGYYASYRGSTADLADAIAHGWFHRGGVAAFHGKPRGTPTDGLPLARFIACLQNHDQVGNRAFGDRLHHAIDPAVWRALSVLLLTLPETPLLFMGQEWAASTPFLYFTDHEGELGEAVDRGRRAEFARFAAFQGGALPRPQDPDTFLRSRLDWSELTRDPHGSVWRLYRDALALRRERLVRPIHERVVDGGVVGARALDAHTIVVEGIGRAEVRYACVCRLRGRGRVRLEPSAALDGGTPSSWSVALSSEHFHYVEQPSPLVVTPASAGVDVAFTRPGAVVLTGRRAAGR